MFLLSKLSSAITQPLFWLAIGWALALLRWQRGRRSALWQLWAGLAMLGVLGFQALPDALLRPLENRYAAPASDTLPNYEGLIVLGGAMGHPDVMAAHGQVPLGEGAERMTQAVSLMRQHPNWQLVFSGGDGRLLGTGVAESRLAEAFFREQGLTPRQMQFEERSRTTRENAQAVAQMLGERCRAPWLLVTSAWHMPRAMAEFEAVGCQVTPYPVDFRTGAHTPLSEYSLAHSLLRWQTALHEWLGLAAYALTR